MSNSLSAAEAGVFFGSAPWCPPVLVTGACLPLRAVQEGEWVRVVDLRGGHAFVDRLAGMGLRSGAVLQVICNPMDGALLVGLGATRLFLGGGMAQKVQVVLVEGKA